MTEPVCAPIKGVDQIFVPHLLKGAMACRYARAASLDYADALDAAVATWETEWETDPEPRTFENANEAVDADLVYWGED
jgi:hypothetical protein